MMKRILIEFLDNTPHNNSPVINSETSKHTDHEEEDSIEFLDNTPHNNSPVINSETSKHTDHEEEDS